jgi:endonuclease YncB( thermonuclease family)
LTSAHPPGVQVAALYEATAGWEWPIARLEEIHDGDTVRLRIDNGFGSRAVEWIRLVDVRAPELREEGGAQARADVAAWFAEHAPDGIVKVTTYRTSAPLEIRFRQSFTRYLGLITAPDGAELNRYLIDKGYVDLGE